MAPTPSTSSPSSSTPSKTLWILHGGETGTSEAIAGRLALEARNWGVTPVLRSFRTFDITLLPHLSHVLFLISTTGQGDMPRAVSPSWRFLLRADLPTTALAGVSFSLFALGDSGYKKFNSAGRKWWVRLRQLGATPFAPRGEGDDQHRYGTEGGLATWTPVMWKGLTGQSPSSQPSTPTKDKTNSGSDSDGVHASVTTVDDSDVNSNNSDAPVELPPIVPPSYIITPVTADALHPVYKHAASPAQVGQTLRDRYLAQGAIPPWGPARPFPAVVKAAYRLTPEDHFQTTVHVELAFGSESDSPSSLARQHLSHQASWQPGDIAMIMPRHSNDSIQTILADRLGWDLDQVVSVTPAMDGLPPIPIPTPVTVRELAASVANLYAHPRRDTFALLAHWTAEEHERERLAYFGSLEGQEFLYDYNGREHRRIGEVLEDFPGLPTVALTYMLDLFPPMTARAYSISSIPRSWPPTASLTVAKVNYKSRLGRPRHGLASKWLSEVKPGDTVYSWIVPGSVPRRLDETRPVLWIGPGTGIAGVRPFVQLRAARWDDSDSAARSKFGDALLVYGGRNKGADFYYGSEWDTYLESGALGGLITAWSRDGPDKVYVQHKMVAPEWAGRIWNILGPAGQGTVLLCGSSIRMPIDIKEALRDVAVSQGPMSQEDADQWLQQLIASGRFIEDTWE